MTTYTKRDLRAVDLLALILVCIGGLLALAALSKVLGTKDGGNSPLLWIGAVCTLALGTALNLKVRQLVRHKGQEPKEYDGVPE